MEIKGKISPFILYYNFNQITNINRVIHLQITYIHLHTI